MSNKTANGLISKAISYFDVIRNSKVDYLAEGNKTIYVDPLGSKIQPLPTELGFNRYDIHGVDGAFRQEIHFQNGSPQQGLNGVSNEAIIATVLHRLTRQNEAFPSPYNVLTITFLQGALSALHSRVKDRETFGISDKPIVEPEKADDALLAKSLAIINALGILGDVIIKFDSAYGLAASGVILSYVETLAKHAKENPEELSIGSAFSLAATAVMGSGTFRGFAKIGSEMLQTIGSFKVEKDNPTNDAS